MLVMVLWNKCCGFLSPTHCFCVPAWLSSVTRTSGWPWNTVLLTRPTVKQRTTNWLHWLQLRTQRREVSFWVTQCEHRQANVRFQYTGAAFLGCFFHYNSSFELTAHQRSHITAVTTLLKVKIGKENSYDKRIQVYCGAKDKVRLKTKRWVISQWLVCFFNTHSSSEISVFSCN